MRTVQADLDLMEEETKNKAMFATFFMIAVDAMTQSLE
jgi:hypothetical protein